jgi:hypothetical protein
MNLYRKFSISIVTASLLLVALMTLSTSVMASEKKISQKVILDTGLQTVILNEPITYGPFDTSGFGEVRIYVLASNLSSGVGVVVNSEVGDSPVFLDQFFVGTSSVATFLYRVMGPAITIQISEAAGAGEEDFRLVLFASP